MIKLTNPTEASLIKSMQSERCFHRPVGEAGFLWSTSDGSTEPSTCSCCSAPSWPEIVTGGVCLVCSQGRPYEKGKGHLLRLALDLGARPLNQTRNDLEVFEAIAG